MNQQQPFSDTGFPIIHYAAETAPFDRGAAHGETYRGAIRELVDIRSQLMREKNARLTASAIEQLAHQQWERTQNYDQALSHELLGICQGASISIEQMVILNNYTDFRDIQMEDQGCSMIYVADRRNPIAGQTWDMHGSAKNYVCVLDIETPNGRQVVFSIVGCVGMMGFNTDALMIGVNNINTDGARAGVMWPVIVRKALRAKTRPALVDCLRRAPVTSGHNYLIADPQGGEMWEILPDLCEKVLDSDLADDGRIFHTNHCLGERTKLREQLHSQTSTTHIRFQLLEKKIRQVSSLEQAYQLLNDHENYPQSICSNFQTSSQDPSITCGGAVGDLASGQLKMWRGDPLYDDNFVIHDFSL